MINQKKGVIGVSPVRPSQVEHAPDSRIIAMIREGGSAAADGAVEMRKTTDELAKTMEDLEDKMVREEGGRPIVSPVCEMPIEQYVQERYTSHTPPQPWCPHCVEARGLCDPHFRNCRTSRSIWKECRPYRLIYCICMARETSPPLWQLVTTAFVCGAMRLRASQ